MNIRQMPRSIVPPKQNHHVAMNARGTPIPRPRRSPAPDHRPPRTPIEIELVKIRSIRSVVPPEDVHAPVVNHRRVRMSRGRRRMMLPRCSLPRSSFVVRRRRVRSRRLPRRVPSHPPSGVHVVESRPASGAPSSVDVSGGGHRRVVGRRRPRADLPPRKGVDVETE